MRTLNRAVLAVLFGALLAGATMFITPGIGSPLSGSAQGQPMAPELAPNLGWLNTDRPLRFSDELRGRVVLLDFWTYCCINCIHILPDLEYLEHKYADEPFIVIGVHSAKFTNEQERESIRQAMFRYDIRHPVVIDSGMGIWSKYGIRGWPGFALIGSDGKLIGIAGGEGQRELLDNAIATALDQGRSRGDLAEGPVRYELDSMVAPATGLTFPGKVLSDQRLGLLFIADSSADRVVVATMPDEAGRSDLVRIVGTGERGLRDGPAETAMLHDPQGFALDTEQKLLFIADTKNHAIRTVDLESWEVRTIAGTGEQSYDRRGGGVGTAQGLASPWDLALSPDRRTLYIAMAGPHQIWEMDLQTRVVRRLAGSGRENSLDGPLDEAALAQPSGLALSADGRRLYFADSESSSVRVVDLDANEVRTTIGHRVSSAFSNGLFEFGDIDGVFPDARLQHVLGVTLLPGEGPGDTLLVADTYNHKLKVLDAEAQSIRTIAGGRAGEAGGSAFDEPGGVHYDPLAGVAFVADTNNHRVVRFDPATGRATEVTIDGLAPSGEPSLNAENAIAAGVAVALGGPVTLSLAAGLPAGATVNEEFPITARVARLSDGRVLAQRTARGVELPIEVELEPGTLRQGDRLLVELSFAWCSRGDSSVCRPANPAWVVTVESGESDRAVLSASIDE
ncbi:MAG: thioredoxin-like domain-containing protein [Phycisphaerales bacterium]